jgi:hypothetical protein
MVTSFGCALGPFMGEDAMVTSFGCALGPPACQNAQFVGLSVPCSNFPSSCYAILVFLDIYFNFHYANFTYFVFYRRVNDSFQRNVNIC